MTFQYEWANLRTKVRIVIDWLKSDECDTEKCISYLEKALEE